MTQTRYDAQAALSGKRHALAFEDTAAGIISTQLLIRAVWALAGVCLLAQLHMQFVQQVNWDEFFFLSRISDYQQTAQGSPLQNLHVHLFFWLPHLPLDVPGQIILARVVMWGLQLGTLTALYLVARRFFGALASAVIVLAYLSISEVMVHGTSFRTDPIAIFFVMTALAVFVRSRFDWPLLITAALCLSLAFLTTIKVVFFAPVFAAVIVMRLVEAQKPLVLFWRLCAAGGIMLALTAGLFFLQLSARDGAALAQSGAGLSSAYEVTLLSAGFIPRATELWRAVVNAPAQTGLLVISFGLASIMAWRMPAQRKTAFVLLMMATPLLTFLFYRNAYPYFLAFILPPVIVLAGVCVERLVSRKLWVLVLSVIMAVMALAAYGERLTKGMDAQRDTLQAVTQMFPEPVPYIDRCSMIAGFPKQGFFMSSWGMHTYHLAQDDVFVQLLSEKTVPLLINNSAALSAALIPEAASGGQQLRAADAQVLRENYIQHWGDIWIAGKSLEVDTVPQPMHIAVPGTYTIEASGPVRIGNVLYRPGDVVSLSRRAYEVTSPQPQALTLRWGEKLYRPLGTPPAAPLFRGF